MTSQVIERQSNLEEEVANREKKTAARSSVFAAIFLTGMKLVIGLVTGSLGIISEALHSALDLVAAGVTYFAVHYAGRPADREHPYGHGKIENISALFETFLLLLTCVWIVYEAIQRLFFKSVEVESSIWSFVIMAISIIVDLSRSRMLSRVAKKHNSQALEADALHFSTDIWSSAVVIAGLFFVFLSEKLSIPWLLKADAIAAMGVAGIVTYVSIQLGRRAIGHLIDEISPTLVVEVTQAADNVPQVLKVLDVRARHSGPNTFIDVTIALEDGTPLDQAHSVAEQVETAVQAVVSKSSVMVHIDPIRQIILA
ncbi:MAG: cation diffusion facilitator family transporter [Anaerolineales bacterium]|jgi:cation diffusion facilitator family transporter|nr:cation diffusion facilitator family transporter [Anaerolineales bacterium]